MGKIIVGLIVVIVIISVFLSFDEGTLPKIQRSSKKLPSSQDSAQVAVYAENLEVPWAIDFLPDGAMLITERSGRVSIINEKGQVSKIADVNVRAIGEGGLHGITVDPNFSTNKTIYLYYTYSDEGKNTLNRVVRYKLGDGILREEKIIVDRIPGASNHDGGRIKFGPDGFLYITTGDAQEPSRAQDKNSLAGKILRVTRDGDPAPGNPFNTRVYSYGHRNPQGITWEENKLWETEHGISPGGLDELNIIEPGKNYGWPTIQGDETGNGLVTPIINSGSNDTWAPAGTAFLNGSIFFAGLRGSALYEYRIDEHRLIEHFKDEYGRLRDIVLGPDNMLYVTTSNRDGRGNPKVGDDKILRINPSFL